VAPAHGEPSARVVSAFGGDIASMTRLPGGQGESWHAGPVVLKPVADEREIAWLATVLARVDGGAEFRVGRPITLPDGSCTLDGWGATRWLEGAHEPGRFDDVLAVSDAFHRALAAVPVTWPAFLRDRTTPWAVGDRAAWGETPIRVRAETVRVVLDRFAPILAGTTTGTPAQVIHGDIGGNVLFADARGLPPAIIDVSPYYRPRSFADAVVVADAVAGDDAPLTFAERYLATAVAGSDMLARALVFRLVAAIELWGAESGRVAAEVRAYEPLVSLIDLP
jgi:uncharacterized protein (TIGR02569 family)